MPHKPMVVTSIAPPLFLSLLKKLLFNCGVSSGNLLQANLWKYVHSVLFAILRSTCDCPPLLCAIFNELRSSAARHFPGKYALITIKIV